MGVSCERFVGCSGRGGTRGGSVGHSSKWAWEQMLDKTDGTTEKKQNMLCIK